MSTEIAFDKSDEYPMTDKEVEQLLENEDVAWQASVRLIELFAEVPLMQGLKLRESRDKTCWHDVEERHDTFIATLREMADAMEKCSIKKS